MHRLLRGRPVPRALLTSLGLIGSALSLASACSEDKTPNFFPDTDAGLVGGRSGGGAGGSSGGGSAARGGSSSGGAAGMGSGGEMAAGSAGQDAGVNTQCAADGDCDDGDPCTAQRCQAGSCESAGFSASGTPCGDATDNACTRPDSCDGAGVCLPNHNTNAAGMACGNASDGECTNPDTCDDQGNCLPNNEAPGTACGSATSTECSGADACDDGGQCSPNDAPVGTSCGSATETECSRGDVCGAGVCLPNDVANGTACTDGSCTQGLCVNGQPVGCPIDVVNSVPANINWSSVGRPNLYGGGCEPDGTPDYALVFTAPADGTFRFAVHGLIDSTPYTGDDTSSPPTAPPDGDAVITVADGSCGGQGAQQLGCDDDGPQGDSNPDSQLDLTLTASQAVTVYLNERTQRGGGTGTLTITQLP